MDQNKQQKISDNRELRHTSPLHLPLMQMITDDEVMKVITNQKVKTQHFPAVFI